MFDFFHFADLVFDLDFDTLAFDFVPLYVALPLIAPSFGFEDLKELFEGFLLIPFPGLLDVFIDLGAHALNHDEF